MWLSFAQAGAVGRQVFSPFHPLGQWPVKSKAEPWAIGNVAPCILLVELMVSKIIQCWKVSSSTMSGAEVETNQEEEVVFWEIVLFQNVLYLIFSFSVTLFLCVADLKEWTNNSWERIPSQCYEKGPPEIRPGLLGWCHISKGPWHGGMPLLRMCKPSQVLPCWQPGAANLYWTVFHAPLQGSFLLGKGTVFVLDIPHAKPPWASHCQTMLLWEQALSWLP